MCRENKIKDRLEREQVAPTPSPGWPWGVGSDRSQRPVMQDGCETSVPPGSCCTTPPVTPINTHSCTHHAFVSRASCTAGVSGWWTTRIIVIASSPPPPPPVCSASLSTLTVQSCQLPSEHVACVPLWYLKAVAGLVPPCSDLLRLCQPTSTTAVQSRHEGGEVVPPRGEPVER